MDYGKILQRAFTITIRHRAIWLFGILAVLFGQVFAQAPNGFRFIVPTRGAGALERLWFTLAAVDVWVDVLLAAIAFVLFIIGIFVRLFSRAAIIGMVNDVEKSESTNAGNGFSYGINNFLRLLAIYLVIWVPFLLVFAILFAISLSPLLLLLNGQQGARVFGIAAAVALVLATVGLVIVVAILLSIAQEFIDRNCVLLGRGVFDSIGDGFRTVRNKFGPAILMWLIMVGVGIIIGMLVFAVAAFLAAVVVVPAIVAWQASSALAITLAIILGLPAFAVFVFLAALVDIFTTAAWTLAYLEITTVGGLH